MSKDKILIGSKIKLNEKAREFTHDLTFIVDDVKSWGVRCHAELGGAALHYNATWDEIENG